jgi:8-amino-7-oxononanoate synthase
MPTTASRAAEPSFGFAPAAGFCQPGAAVNDPAKRELPAITFDTIVELLQAEVDRLPAPVRLSWDDSFSECGIDSVAFHDVVHRIESRYQMRFRTEWLEGVDCWKDLASRIETHLVDRRDAEERSRRRHLKTQPVAEHTINLTSTDYLGLSGHPDVVTAAKEAIDCFGCSMPSGELAEPYAAVVADFEHELASFLGVERAAAVPAEHGAMTAVFERLVGEGDLVLIDRDARPGLARAAEASRAACRQVSLSDERQLIRLLGDTQGRSRRRVVVVEAISSVTGVMIDLPRLLRLKAAHDFVLVIDESDSFGTVGGGRGIAAHFRVDPQRVDLWITSQWRCFGGGGGYVAGRDPLVRYLETAGHDAFSRRCLPSTVAAARRGLALIADDDRRVEALAERCELFRKLAADCDLDLGESLDADGPVITVRLGGPYRGMEIARALLDQGLHADVVSVASAAGPESRLRVRITLAIHDEGIATAVRLIVDTLGEF